MSLARGALPIIPVLFIVALAFLHGAEAAESYKGKGVGVIISKSCLLSDRCLKYSDIISLDSTDPAISGHFVDGKRQPTKLHNEHRFYKNSDTFVVAVDPTDSFARAFPRIEIVTELREYHIPTQMKVLEYKVTPDAKATKQVRSYSHTWYVDATCTNAIISAEHYEKLLPQMIYYLQSNCQSNTIGFANVSVDIKDLTKHDITTSQKWQDEKRLDWIRQNCLHERNACTEIDYAPKPQSHMLRLVP